MCNDIPKKFIDTPKKFFGSSVVRTVTLADWMNWAYDKATDWRIVLPMIQRGSVWAPHKILDLWDTLLRGMPIGAVMASDAKDGKHLDMISKVGVDKLGNAVSLVDGQQRTLAMLAGWPNSITKAQRPVSIWVDLADEAQNEYQFRLWVATGAQPFGYERISAGSQTLSKLARYKRRLANIVYEEEVSKDSESLWERDDFMPWEAKFALNLGDLIKNQNNLDEFIEAQRQKKIAALELLQREQEKNLKYDENANNEIENLIKKHFEKVIVSIKKQLDVTRIEKLKSALANLSVYEFPVIRVAKEFFEDSQPKKDENRDPPKVEDSDPPLAVLFKRVGSGGEPLSNADYIYSIIKYHAEDAHELVEGVLADPHIRAIYTPTSLVMSAVRLTIFSMASGNKNAEFTDSADMNKAVFARLIRKQTGFIDEFNKQISKGGLFEITLNNVLKAIRYEKDNFKIGLPKHALCLIDIPMLETVLAWYYKANPGNLNESRLPIVRFLLHSNLSVRDKNKASMACIKYLQENNGIIFPDSKFIKLLSDKDNNLAYQLPSPEELEEDKNLISAEGGKLRGWTRFHFPDSNEVIKNNAAVYKLWWNRRNTHSHPMLLWLQREYVYEKFEKCDALAGMGDETPYDYDHILPSAHWAGWTGNLKGTRFMDFRIDGDMTGDSIIGNAIGNIHVLDSSDNRSLCDTAPHKKLYINKDSSAFRKSALIDEADEVARLWESASVVEDKDYRFWDAKRAGDFQRVVEYRTFSLYKKFYTDLKMSEIMDDIKAVEE